MTFQNNDVNSQSINSRIKEIKINYFGDERGSHKLFCDAVGVKSNTASNWMKDGYSIGMDVISQILKAFPDVRSNWLLTGEGKMSVDDNVEIKEILSTSNPVPAGANYKLVPVVHVDSVGGIHSHNEVSSFEPHYIEGYVPFVNAKDGDKAIFQTGNSMIPTCPPGSLLQVREVPNWREYFGYGNIFVIELKDGRRITKEVNRFDENPKDFVWCKSHNPNVADEELPKSMIASVWKVVKILTDKGW